jgi:hypothetical protein
MRTQSCLLYFLCLLPIPAKKSSKFLYFCFQQGRMATEDDINILSSEAKEAKERLSRDRTLKIDFVKRKQSSPRNRRSLSGDSIRDENQSGAVPKAQTRTLNFPGGHRSLPRLSGAFKTKEEEEAVVRRLLQPLRRD